MACVLCNRKCVDIQTRAFRNQLAKECDTWTNARSIVRTNFVRQKFRERLCRSSNLFFKPFHTLNTLLGWSRVYDFFHVQFANFWKHQQPTSLCTVLLDFKSSSKETSLWLLLVVETGNTCPGVASATIQNCNRGGQCKVRLSLIEKLH